MQYTDYTKFFKSSYLKSKTTEYDIINNYT